MAGVDFAQLAKRLGLDLDQVLEAVSLGPDLRGLASTTTRAIFSAVDLDRSRAQHARPETDAEYDADEGYFERWSG